MSKHKQSKDLSNKEKTYEEAFVDINLYLLKDYKRGYIATYWILLIMIL